MINFFNPCPQFTDLNGNPLSGGKITFYDTDTVTLKPVYTDYAGTTPTNEVILPADGRIQLYATGLYSVKVERLVSPGTWALEYTVPVYKADDNTAAGSIWLQVNNIDDLREVDAVVYPIVNVLGYTVPGDGGGGVMIYRAASGYTPNDFTVFQSNSGAGQWVRAWVPVVTPMMAGVFPNGLASTESRFSAISQWCQSIPIWSKLYIPSGTYPISGVATFAGAGFTVELAPGVVFESVGFAGRVVVTCGDFVPSGDSTLIVGNQNGQGLSWFPKSSRIPNLCWFGQPHDALSDHGVIFGHAIQPGFNGVGALVISRPTVMANDLSGAPSDCINTALIFEATGYLYMQGSTVKVYKYENRAPLTCFAWTDTASLAQLTFWQTIPRISHFTTGALLGIDLGAIQQCISRNEATDNGILAWDIPVTITGTPNAAGPIIHNRFEGGYIDGSADKYVYGYIDADDFTKVFTVTTQSFTISNLEVFASWWGDNSTADRGYGLAAGTANNYIVNGGNRNVVISVPLVQPTSALGGTIHWKDIYITQLSANKGDDMITMDHTLYRWKMENVTIEGRGDKDNITRMASAAKFVQFSNCTFQNVEIQTFGPHTSGHIHECNVLSAILHITQGDNLLTSGNVYGALDFADTNILNTIHGQILIDAAISGGKVDNLQVIGNAPNWIDGISVAAVYAGKIVAGNCLAGAGTRVADNASPGGLVGADYTGTTELDYRVTSVDDAANPWTVDFAKPARLIMAGTQASRVDVLGISRNDTTDFAAINVWSTSNSAGNFVRLKFAKVWSSTSYIGTSFVNLKVYA